MGGRGCGGPGDGCRNQQHRGRTPGDSGRDQLRPWHNTSLPGRRAGRGRGWRGQTCNRRGPQSIGRARVAAWLRRRAARQQAWGQTRLPRRWRERGAARAPSRQRGIGRRGHYLGGLRYPRGWRLGRETRARGSRVELCPDAAEEGLLLLGRVDELVGGVVVVEGGRTAVAARDGRARRHRGDHRGGQMVHGGARPDRAAESRQLVLRG